MSAKGGATAIGGTGDFYVMFAGALVNTVTSPAEATGFVSTGFWTADDDYDAADYATYHKFTYTAAYA
jgi:hypothetical protein